MKIKLNGMIKGFRESSEGTADYTKIFSDFVITDVTDVLSVVSRVESCCPSCEAVSDIIECLEKILISACDNMLEVTYKVCHEEVEGGIVVDIATTYHY